MTIISVISFLGIVAAVYAAIVLEDYVEVRWERRDWKAVQKVALLSGLAMLLLAVSFVVFICSLV